MIILQSLDNLPSLAPPAIVTLGNFDGLHRGHKRILRKVISRAREEGGTSVLVTFEPHPLKVLHPERAPALILLPDQKRRSLSHLGLQVLVEVPFSPSLASFDAQTFARVFAAAVKPKEIYVGEDFRFGKGREGDIALLQAVGPELGFRAWSFPKLRVGGEEVSSSRIRRLLLEGAMEDAVRLLGRPYIIEGEVLRGRARGRSLGYPTANLAVENELVPALGVYAAAVDIGEDPLLPGVANLGTRPTFEGDGGKEVLLEVHILRGAHDMYGQHLRCLLFKFLRPERRFSSPEDLKAAITGDIEGAWAYLAALPLKRRMYR